MNHNDKDPFVEADRLMHEAVSEGVFPGAVLLAARDDAVLFHRAYGVTDLATGQPVTPETVFDLASMTKPLATTLAMLYLVAGGQLSLDAPLETLLPAFAGRPAARVTVEQLLRHTSGLPAWYPYFETLRSLPPAERWKVLHRRLRQAVPEAPAGTRTIYSDLNFLILGWIAETLSGARLDRLVAETIYRPLGVAPLYFIPIGEAAPVAEYAATERCPWRGLLCGQVHDDNCYCLGGVCGHAGLFGTAGAVHRLLCHLRSGYRGRGPQRLLPSALVRTFIHVPPDGRRALGFDVPSADPPACGRHFSPDTVGHLGFTGTSFWMDLARGVIVVLLTNRVHPVRTNEAIKAFRPRLHDLINEGIGA